MNTETINTAIAEAHRFIKRAEALKTAAAKTRDYYYSNPKEQGATRRASMDLTRALADLRRSN